MKGKLRQLSAFLLVMALLCTTNTGRAKAVDTDQGIAPQYNVISQLEASLTVSRSGKATCKAKVTTPSVDYSVTLTCDLCKDGNVIKSWTASGKGSASLDKSWYVTSGSDYQVVASATVYNSAGNYIDSGTAYSNVVSY